MEDDLSYATGAAQAGTMAHGRKQLFNLNEGTFIFLTGAL
jgi:hypothetical protein